MSVEPGYAANVRDQVQNLAERNREGRQGVIKALLGDSSTAAEKGHVADVYELLAAESDQYQIDANGLHETVVCPGYTRYTSHVSLDDGSSLKFDRMDQGDTVTDHLSIGDSVFTIHRKEDGAIDFSFDGNSIDEANFLLLLAPMSQGQLDSMEDIDALLSKHPAIEEPITEDSAATYSAVVEAANQGLASFETNDEYLVGTDFAASYAAVVETFNAGVTPFVATDEYIVPADLGLEEAVSQGLTPFAVTEENLVNEGVEITESSVERPVTNIEALQPVVGETEIAQESNGVFQIHADYGTDPADGEFQTNTGVFEGKDFTLFTSHFDFENGLEARYDRLDMGDVVYDSVTVGEDRYTIERGIDENGQPTAKYHLPDVEEPVEGYRFFWALDELSDGEYGKQMFFNRLFYRHPETNFADFLPQREQLQAYGEPDLVDPVQLAHDLARASGQL